MITVQAICMGSNFDILNAIESVVNILAALLGGFCAVKGIRYISALKKKRLAATFSFWVQLWIRIEELQQILAANFSVINGMYSSDVRWDWNPTGTSSNDEAVAHFYECAQETLEFLKNVSDQIPASNSWLEKYMDFVKFLIDVTQYDIRDYNTNFKFFGTETLTDRNQYVQNALTTMNTLLDTIKKQQKEVASRL